MAGSFRSRLAPGATWHSCLAYDLSDGGQRYVAPDECTQAATESKGSERLADWQCNVLKVGSSNDAFRRRPAGGRRYGGAALADPAPTTCSSCRPRGAVVRGAVRPRQPDRIAAERRWFIPSLRAGRWKCSARYQATERDDYRDAEPGKIMHELRLGNSQISS